MSDLNKRAAHDPVSRVGIVNDLVGCSTEQHCALCPIHGSGSDRQRSVEAGCLEDWAKKAGPVTTALGFEQMTPLEQFALGLKGITYI